MKRDDALKQVDAGLQELNEALSAGRSEQLTRYLEVMAKFHRYSFGNVMLILAQRPDASQVAGFHRWRQLGRRVKKGAKGIGILAPLVYKTKDPDDDDARTLRGFKIVHVFDASDTEGEELPEFAAVAGDPGDNLARLEQAIREAGVELLYEDLPLGTLGESSGGTIRIQPGLSSAETFAVAVHELAHERLHHGKRRHATTKQIRETEAEAAAFVVCRACGLDSKTKSADYIQLYRGTSDTLAESLEYIQKVSFWMIERITAVQLPDDPTPNCRRPLQPVDVVAASPSFNGCELGNDNSEIRRVDQRLPQAAREASVERLDVDHGVCRCVENVAENRVQILFHGKPPQATRELLKRLGFRWSRRNTAWQRLLNDAGRQAARRVVATLVKEDAPA